ncbi:U2 small nuclear ribonucleoprotein auxiliary factor 35 kDa subunit-related protein 1-like [Osmerus eperlanus]|uniref:U2 small nuclear ribonucleoprotein auxiliary factor 35 kDa subunit-related protein 1-like n=1 Tax=Osmerus eperlanus TaxID=29151 RepID=UPI002E10A26D
MAHVKKFQDITMSKSMRGMCKEEDYEFLGSTRKTEHLAMPEEPNTLENEWKDRREERVRRRQERERQEQERQRELEESKREKELQWRTHIAELASTQEQALQDRLSRLRRFREFQRKVMVEELGVEPESNCEAVDQLLTRM